MHEFSIVESLLELIQEYVEKNNGKSVYKIELKVGKMSGVEPYLLQVAFDSLKEGTVAEKAQLTINIQDVVAMCNKCNKTFLLDDLNFSCPECKNSDIDVIDGKDIILQSIDIEI